MNKNLEVYKHLPAVSKLLKSSIVSEKIEIYGRQIVLNSIRKTLEYFRQQMINPETKLSEETIIYEICKDLEKSNKSYLKKVVNASGIIINTNLGRTPISESTFDKAKEIACNYSNLEFDLIAGKRGNRNSHLKEILCQLTGAEDALIVNNAAAAVLLCLNTFAKRKEVIVSRGELIEIGGSFRIPEVMKAAGCKMIEVGTTNKTKISDYQNAINRKTALLFKAHQSNFVIKGFTEEVNLKDLVNLGRKHNLPTIYDLGSGLLEKSEFKALNKQIDVKTSLKLGADLIIFSGDKLLGGPQAGIIIGKKQLVKILEKNQLLRALRVDKTTIALLEASFKLFLNKNELYDQNFIFQTLSLSKNQIKNKAEILLKSLKEKNIQAEIIPNKTLIGGGTNPENEIDSFAVKIIFSQNKKENSNISAKIYKQLMLTDIPIIGILRKGELLFDLIACSENEILHISKTLETVLKKL